MNNTLKTGRRRALLLAAFSALASLPGCDMGQLILSSDPWDPPPKSPAAREPIPREACSNVNKDRQPLFGDLHLHTSLSMDANSLGTRTLPDDAYAFAKGRPVGVWGALPQ